jgi:glyoxylase-like metal-dependent hydrolase (beta-lactamase superfamily II)
MTTAGLSTGLLGDPSAVRSLRMDDVLATYVVDGVLQMQASAFFPGIPADFWSARPDLFTSVGTLPMSAGGLLVEREGTTLLIDAGVGTTTTDFAMADICCGAMIDVLEVTGNQPEDIDVLAFTHLHFDHAGWAFANGDKTFPNARYVVAAKEWTPYAERSHRRDSTTPWQVIEKMASDDTELELVDDGDEIAPGVQAVVTPGHSPGHTSYVITSQSGRRLVAFGDAFHVPAQLAHPEWLSIADTDSAGVIKARRRLLAELAQPQTVGFGFHFGDQAFGRTTTGGAGQTNWEPVPTSLLAPPPRLSH